LAGITRPATGDPRRWPFFVSVAVGGTLRFPPRQAIGRAASLARPRRAAPGRRATDRLPPSGNALPQVRGDSRRAARRSRLRLARHPARSRRSGPSACPCYASAGEAPIRASSPSRRCHAATLPRSLRAALQSPRDAPNLKAAPGSLASVRPLRASPGYASTGEAQSGHRARSALLPRE